MYLVDFDRAEGKIYLQTLANQNIFVNDFLMRQVRHPIVWV